MKSDRIFDLHTLGRCGQGAVYFLEQAGVSGFLEWDMEETAKGGPFPEILDNHIFVNCIYLMGSIPPFITKGSPLVTPFRFGRLICDLRYVAERRPKTVCGRRCIVRLYQSSQSV